MLDKEWCYCGRPDCAGYAVAELNELHYETPGDTRRTWEKDLHRRLYTIPTQNGPTTINLAEVFQSPAKQNYWRSNSNSDAARGGVADQGSGRDLRSGP
jgi:hypothetical protein